MLRIYLIRHGETTFNAEGKEWGQPADTTLDCFGVRQCKELAKKLQKIKFNKFFSSTYKRALQTTDIINSENVHIVKDERLREYDNGEIDPFSEIWINEYKKKLELTYLYQIKYNNKCVML